MDEQQGSPLERRLTEIRTSPSTVPFEYEALERRARETLPDHGREYVGAEAGSGGTARANEEAFDAWHVLPRVLRDVPTRSLETELFGRTYAGPIGAAPVGRQTRYHPEGELATARACAELGVPFAVSTASANTLEAVAAAGGDSPRLFQLYWLTDDAVTGSLVERAGAAGYSAILVTVDTLAGRWTPSLVRSGASASSTMPNVAEDPVAREEGLDEPGALGTVDSLTWDDLAMLREWTDLPIVVKGISHPEDARTAVDHGLDGVVVSNHGGRALDGAVGTLDVLPAIADELAGEVPLLFDGGIRNGTDAFKAIALGADVVLVGRPFIYGLALSGERGVYETLHNLLAELDSAAGMAGYSDADSVGREALVSEETLRRARRRLDANSGWFEVSS